jgi:tungstate transport system ATP-binding protein
MILYQIDHLVHSYNKGAPVLSIDHWTVTAGGITGLIGPNGSGKSTLLKLLGLIESPRCGEILFEGQKTAPFARGLRNRITLLPQVTGLLQRSIYHNIAYGLRIRKDRRDEAARVREAMALVGLTPDRFAGDRPWFALSGGEAHRVALAARLVLRPQVLLLDEPTTSVDDASAQLMKEAVLHAHRQWGTSLIIASHDTQWLQDVCDSTVHLFKGRLLGERAHTLLHGPWQDLDDRHVCTQLTDERVFVASKPPAEKSSPIAAIDPIHLSLFLGQQLPDGQRSIDGLLVSLALDKQASGIEAAVLVGQILFKVQMTADAASSAGLIPGRMVSLTYDPEAVQWL